MSQNLEGPALMLIGELANTSVEASGTPAPPESGRLLLPSLSASADEELVLAARAGDLRATTLIWMRYSAQVRAKMSHWIEPQDMDDLVQEVFSRLFAQLARIREPSALRRYIIGVTFRVTFGELRRRYRSRLHLTAAGELPEPHHSGPFRDSGPDREALWRFESILNTLAPSSRRIFILRYVDKLELVDVAAAMGISLATVKRHLVRAAGPVATLVDREPALAEYVQEGGHGSKMKFATRADARGLSSAS
jgi:RNA polymerase sigma-70 factor, ECF subfamily